jgi:hypothetical protein
MKLFRHDEIEANNFTIQLIAEELSTEAVNLLVVSLEIKIILLHDVLIVV